MNTRALVIIFFHSFVAHFAFNMISSFDFFFYICSLTHIHISFICKHQTHLELIQNMNNNNSNSNNAHKKTDGEQLVARKAQRPAN